MVLVMEVRLQKEDGGCGGRPSEIDRERSLVGRHSVPLGARRALSGDVRHPPIKCINDSDLETEE